jgi:hypothetical protein
MASPQSKKTYISLLAEIYAEIIFKFSSSLSDPRNLQLIKQQALEAYIYLYKNRNDVFTEFKRNINFFIPKY